MYRPLDTIAVALASLPIPVQADVQSALHPAGPDADKIAEITWVMFAGATAIFLLVLGILALALYGGQGARGRLSRHWLIITGGIAFPIVVLSALLFYSLSATPSYVRAATPPAARIEVIGEMWWWRLRYIDEDGDLLFETANDIRIPAGVPVDLLLRSDNVIHSFWVPNLAGKLDMVPGRVNRLRLQADKPGFFRGQCAEYCGAQHAKMMFDVHALSLVDFNAWVASQRLPAMDPKGQTLQTGKRIVMQACAECHTIRGTEAAGTLGPDLTHIGSRSSLAAGVLPKNVGTLAGWIADSQHIKPGNRMPSFNKLDGADLRAVAQYLESLQ